MSKGRGILGTRWVSLRRLAVVAVIVGGALAPSMVAGGRPVKFDGILPIAGEDLPPVPKVHTDQEAQALDAAQFAQDLGVPAEEASAYLARRPLIDELRQYLLDNAKPTFSDMYLAYDPYRIVILSLGNGKDEMDLISAEGRFQEIVTFIEVQPVDYTEALLVKAMDQVGLLSGVTGTQASDADIRTGTVTVWVDSEDAAASLIRAIQDAEALGELLIPAASIDVLVGGGDVPTLDSFAGNPLNLQSSGASECTSAFSVEQTGGGVAQGVSTAGHCGMNLEFANGDNINFVAQMLQNSQDVQWHTTTNYTDQPWMRDSPSTVRNVTARRTRTQMMIGDPVCKYGRTTQYTCGVIESKVFQPTGFNATFIRVDDGSDTLVDFGDSGGPWFFGTTAYGIHRSFPNDDPTDAVFMAQNYMSVLNIRVKIL